MNPTLILAAFANCCTLVFLLFLVHTLSFAQMSSLALYCTSRHADSSLRSPLPSLLFQVKFFFGQFQNRDPGGRKNTKDTFVVVEIPIKTKARVTNKKQADFLRRAYLPPVKELVMANNFNKLPNRLLDILSMLKKL